MIESFEEKKEQLEVAIQGYFCLVPNIEDNEYYCTFRSFWNQLALELAKAELSDANSSISAAILGATRRKEGLLKTAYSYFHRVNKSMENIFKTIDACQKTQQPNLNFGRSFALRDSKANNELGHLGLSLRKLQEIWKDYGFYDYKFISTDKSVHEYIGSQLDYLEKITDRMGLQYAKFLGLERALDHLNHEDQLPYYDVKPMLDASQNAFCYSSIADCTIDTLFNWGHTVKDAMSIRFLNLTMMNKLSHDDAFEQIRKELIHFGLYQEEHFPDEAKIIADRARRLRNKRWKELRALSA